MEQYRFVGSVIRGMRLERNWSQETLCGGICAVSYLSKIEQGRVIPNEQLIRDLFAKLDISWETDPEIGAFCDGQMDRVFFCEDLDREAITQVWENHRFGPWHLDLMLLHAYCDEDHPVPQDMLALLDPRQRCLAALLADEPEKGHQYYPCPLTMLAIGQKAYGAGEYTTAVEYLQMAYDAACTDGLVHIMLASQIYMSNCYSDLQNRSAMDRHVAIASRLARNLHVEWAMETLAYNQACTAIEVGDPETAYRYFSALPDPGVLELHKLAICCEYLGKRSEALDALTQAEEMLESRNTLHGEMCAVVRRRLETTDYLRDEQYGRMLMALFGRLRREMPVGYARFHLPWVKEWLTANRRYREAYELMLDFPGCGI